MKSVPCPECGTFDAFVDGSVLDCRNVRCKFYSAKWAGLIQPGGEPFYVPPQIGSGRFAAIAGDLNPNQEKIEPEPEKPKQKRPPAPVTMAPQLRRVVVAKKQRSILFESPGSPRMLWVSREHVPEISPSGWFRVPNYDFQSMPEGVWDIVAFSGKGLERCSVQRFEMGTRYGTKSVLAYNQPMQFFTEPSACLTPFVKDLTVRQMNDPDLDVEISRGDVEVRFRVMFWGRPIERERASLDGRVYRSGIRTG
jgi:hypothetical protein